MDQSDPFGLYHLLGLTPSASMKEIKAAGYRRPYYIPSGDESDKAFAEAFRRTPEAYEVLSDPARRANYDWFARNLPAEAIEPDGSVRYDLNLIPDGLLHCSLCGKIALQPRYITLSYAAFEEMRRGTRVVERERLLCVSCVDAARSRRDFEEPVSSKNSHFNHRHPFYLLYMLFKVGLGEKHDRLTDQKLILHNVRALLEQGDIKTAYGLAKLIRKSGDEAIAGEVAEILRIIDASGTDYSGYPLKDDWALSGDQQLLYSLLAFFVPAAVIVVVYLINAKETAPAFQPVPAGVAAPRCARPPETSQVLTRRAGTQGDLTLRIRNASGHKAIVKVRDRKSALVATLFLKGEDSIDLSGLPGGNYRIQFSLGSMLDPTCRAFLDTGAIFELHEFNKRVISSFSTGREIIGYDLEADTPTHRRLSKAEFEQGS